MSLAFVACSSKIDDRAAEQFSNQNESDNLSAQPLIIDETKQFLLQHCASEPGLAEGEVRCQVDVLPKNYDTKGLGMVVEPTKAESLGLDETPTGSNMNPPVCSKGKRSNQGKTGGGDPKCKDTGDCRPPGLGTGTGSGPNVGSNSNQGNPGGGDPKCKDTGDCRPPGLGTGTGSGPNVGQIAIKVTPVAVIRSAKILAIAGLQVWVLGLVQDRMSGRIVIKVTPVAVIRSAKILAIAGLQVWVLGLVQE